MRLIGFFLLLVVAIGAADRTLATVRLKRDPGALIHGWIVQYDHDAFKLERFGGSRRITIPWDDVVDEDSLALRRKLGLALPEDERPKEIAAKRLWLKGGGYVEGVLVHVDEQKRHWLKQNGLLLPYPGDRIEKITDIELDERRIYSPDELYLRRLAREKPSTPDQHVDLGSFLYDIGAFERARYHYGMAIAGNPLLRPVLQARLSRIENLLSDRAAARVYRSAKRMAFQLGDTGRAVAMLEDYTRQRPDLKRRTLAMIDEIRERRAERVAQTFHRVKNEEVARSIDRYLIARSPTFADATRWILHGMPDDVKTRVCQRLRIKTARFAELAKTTSKAALHWATYWSGSWTVSKRAKGRKRDPEDWWAQYENLSTRSSFLKAYGAERLPRLFDVRTIRHHLCERCGGNGLVTKWNAMPRKGQPQQWNEVCPRCRGVGRDRAVGYR